MKRKSSKTVSLVLITATLAACAKPTETKEEQQRVFMRADSSAPYTEVTNQYAENRGGGMGMGSALLWYMAFRPMMGGGMGYTSNGISPQSNVGSNTTKSDAFKKQAARGGFGTTNKHESASS